MGKNILVLSGGGSRGAFEGGVLYTLFKKGKRFDKIIGCSVGSLNSLIWAQCCINNSPDLFETVWTKLIKKDSSVYKKNYLKTITLSAPFSFSPLKKLLNKYADFQKIIESEIELWITCCDLVSGQTEFIQNRNIGPENLLSAIIGSASIPPVFPPVKVNIKGREMQLVDGGVRDNIPIKAIKNNEGDNITIILCAPLRTKIKPKKYKNIFKISSRAIDIMMDECMRNDLETMILVDSVLKISLETPINEIHRKKMPTLFANKRIINPEIIIPDSIVTKSSLEFNQEELIKGFETGKNYLDESKKIAPISI